MWPCGIVRRFVWLTHTIQHGSDAFREFLVLLGNIVPLKGHEGYRAGLNVQNNRFARLYGVTHASSLTGASFTQTALDF